MEKVILVSNPGSASRKYALYIGDKCLLKIHFEQENGKIIYSLEQAGQKTAPHDAGISHLTFAAAKIELILDSLALASNARSIDALVIRIVAPSKYFQDHHILDGPGLKMLSALEPRSSLHINIVLQEINVLKAAFGHARVLAISDSAFHRTLPDHAANYALPLGEIEKYEIKRYGYHGLSVESIVGQLKYIAKLPQRLVVCHLGSGASVTAVRDGKSIDTTMGYSPLEGLMMATRSGSIDITAAQVLADELKLDAGELQDLLNHKSGLQGISGSSSDIRRLLELEKAGNKRAELALKMFVYRAQQGIAQTAAALGGIDTLVFTGTVGERSAEIRKRIVHTMNFLGLELDAKSNHEYSAYKLPELISPARHPAKIFVAASDEEAIMACHALRLI